MEESCKNVYITTPIYYVNDVAHIGHAYTTIIADMLARYSRLTGLNTFLLTGTDEHGQKISQSAELRGKTPKEYADEISGKFRTLWDDFDITYDKFIRTTDVEHKLGVQKAFQTMFDKGDIYKGEYEGFYCVSCETFFTEKQLVDEQFCPDCGRPTSIVKEESYFFKLSKYEDKLIKWYEENEDCILPRAKKNEISNFVKGGLRDLSISRTSFDWGVSYNKMTNIIPDRMQNTIIPFTWDDPNSRLVASDVNQSDNHRYYQEMTDDEIAGNFVVSYKFGKKEDNVYKGKFIAGYGGRYKEINFDATQINLFVTRSLFATQPTVDLNYLDGYFNQTNLDAGFFSLRTFRGNVTNPNALKPQNYNGQQIISAGYGAIEYQFSPKLFVIGAFRTEFIIQDIFYDTSLKSGKTLFDTMEYMPSLTAKYEINEKQNIKFAASKTYTLPQFKERAPFLYEEVGQSYIGNPFLYNSTDYNFDLKWEMFPKNGEVISVTGFAKYIQNPINQVTIASATNDISWVNSGDKAVGLGIEGEWRKNIISRENNTTGEKTNLGFGLNISYLLTNQDLNSEKVVNENPGMNVDFTNSDSRLTGASDLLINSDISFNKEFKNDKSLTATLAGGYFSDRIYALGVTGKGDLVDSDVITLDFILKLNLSKNIGIGFSAKNLTDPTIERKQDIQNVVVDSYKKGRNFGLSVKYSF